MTAAGRGLASLGGAHRKVCEITRGYPQDIAVAPLLAPLNICKNQPP